MLAALAAAQLHLAMHGLSYHTAHRHPGESYNELNLGAGVRATVDDWSLQVSYVRNSYGKPSPYAIVDWTPIRFMGANIGASLGVTSNYPLNNGGPIPVGDVLARWQGDKMSTTVRLIPPIDGKHAGVATVEFGWRIK